MFCRRVTVLFRRHPLNSNLRCLCKESPPSDVPPSNENENKESKKEEKNYLSNDEAKNKLNSLLASFTKGTSKPAVELKIARPHGTKNLVRNEPMDENARQGKRFENAAEDVAKSFGVEVEQTKKDLVDQVKIHQGIPEVESETDTPRVEHVQVEPKIPMSDESKEKFRQNLSATLTGMKIEQSPAKEQHSDRSRTRRDGRRIPEDYQSGSMAQSRLHEFRTPSYRDRERGDDNVLDFENVEPLNILISERESRTPTPEGSSSVLSIWDELNLRDMKIAVTHPPRNCFEEMIRWTNKDMLWKLPLDNETELEDNAVSFADHIFLERHLDGWCPRKGPIRHFMELVCTGLSKNPYLTVERKKAHIEWYKNYFAEKEELLKDIGALQQ